MLCDDKLTNKSIQFLNINSFSNEWEITLHFLSHSQRQYSTGSIQFSMLVPPKQEK